MAKHRRVRGRHRAPTTPGRAAARVATVGVLGALPLGIGSTAHAGPPGGWGPIIACESGGDPRAQNPTSSASGLFQFLDSTWRSVGGTGRARDASVEEQYRRAEMLYAQRGTQPWNASKSCWAGKVGTAPPPPAPKPAPAPKPEPSRAAAPTAPAASAPASRGGSHTVVAGETLSRIAADHGTTWQQLHARNRDSIPDPDLIFPGQRVAL